MNPSQARFPRRMCAIRLGMHGMMRHPSTLPLQLPPTCGASLPQDMATYKGVLMWAHAPSCLPHHVKSDMGTGEELGGNFNRNG